MTSIEPHIGTYNESDLHLALKQHYASDPSQIEQSVDGYVVDVVRDDRLIEIQTRGFSALRKKIPSLLTNHKVTLVHPIPERKTIVKLQSNGSSTRRLSPKRGSVFDIFHELVSLPGILNHEGFQLDIVMTHEDEIRTYDRRRGWRRRGWVVEERQLRKIVETRSFTTATELFKLLRPNLSLDFTTADLATVMNRNRSMGQKAAYCLREMGVIETTGKRGNSLVYRSSDSHKSK